MAGYTSGYADGEMRKATGSKAGKAATSPRAKKGKVTSTDRNTGKKMLMMKVTTKDKATGKTITEGRTARPSSSEEMF